MQGWEELLHTLPQAKQLRLGLFGPELAGLEESPDARASSSILYGARETCPACARAGVTRVVAYKGAVYHELLHKFSGTESDLIVAFNAGFHDPAYTASWAPTISAVLATGRPFLVTGYTSTESKEDYEIVLANGAAHGLTVETVVPPTANPYASLMLHDDLPVDEFYAENAWYFIVRGSAAACSVAVPA